MRLRSKILGGTILLLLAVSATTILTVRYVVVQKLEAELVKRGEAIARYIAAGAFNPILTEDFVSLRQILLDAAVDEQDISYLFVINSEGRILGHTFTGGFPTALRTANGTDGGSAPSTAHLTVDGTEVYDIAMPIAGGDLGTVRAGFRASVIKSGVQTVMNLGAVITMVMTFIAGLVAMAMETRIFKPVSRLTEAAVKIGRGHFDMRVDEEGDDEIGTLARTFNGMMDHIEETRSELLGANEDLEMEIIERQGAEKRVREREREMVTIFDSSPVLMALVAGDGVIKKMNRAWSRNRAEVTGSEEEARIGSALGCLLAIRNNGECGAGGECDRCLIKKTINVAMERDVQLRQVEAAVSHKDGHDVFFLVSATPIAIGSEKLVLVSIEDITPLKMTELELKKAFDELERQNEELRKIDIIKSSIIRDVTHELKTPVAKFVMQLEMLEAIAGESPSAAKMMPGMRSMKENLVRQQNVIRNILDLSRLEKGGRSYRREPVRLDDMMAKLAVEYGMLLDGKGITLEKDLDPVLVASDADMLWHVFSNLLGNAIKFTGNSGDGRILLRAKKKGGNAVVTVEDNGVGLSEELSARVFDPFVQSTASEEGIGVGLTISRMIMDGLGGTMELKSEGPGRGATASVTLPAES